MPNSPPNVTNIPSNRVEIIDPRTGMVSREWYRFFLNLFNLAGSGGNQTSLDDLQIGPPPQPTTTSGGSGTVTSVDVSGGTTGLTTSGGPVTTSGTITIAGTLNVANGGTGSTTAAGAPFALKGANTDITSLSGITGSIGSPTYMQFGSGSGTALAAGRMWYDNSTGSLNFGMGNGNITQQVGEELFIYGKASAAITDSPLQIIRHTGTVGASGVITFAPTIAGITNANDIIGVATESLALNAFGRVTTYGLVRGITTNGTAFGETWADDDVIWYNPVTGNPTKVEPVAPYIKMQIGLVVSAGSGGSGSFQVGLQRGSTLGGTDSNVQFGTLANNNLIAYDSTLGYWKNVTSSTLGFVTSVTGTSPVVSSGGTTPAISLAASYGDTQNPYASKTANYFLAAPNGSAGVPTFRAVVAADIPTLNQNTTGSAATLTTGRTIAITGDLAYTSPSFNGSANVTAAGTLATVNANVGSFTNATLTVNGKGLITAASSGTAPVTSVTGTSPVVSSGGTTPAISLATAYGDTLNPYASKTANFFLAAPNGVAGAPTFRAVVAADIPTLNQNTTGSAATLTTGRTIAITGDLAYTSGSFNGSANVTGAGTLATVNANVGSFTYATLTVNGKGLITAASSGTAPVTSVTATSPVASTGGATPVISMPAATTSVSGYLTSTDWTTFNNKGSGTVTAVSVASANGFAGTSSGGATPALTLSTTITGVLKGNATAISAATSGTDYSAGTSALTTGILKSTTTTGALSIAVAADFPTLNQNTTGTASNVTGTVAIANGGTGQTTQQAALTALSGTQTSGQYLRSNGTNTLLSAIQVADVPTLNQNTTGTASNVTGTVAIANGGTGQTTANTAFNALAPSQTANSGKYLTTDGTNTSWATVASSSNTNAFAFAWFIR